MKASKLIRHKGLKYAKKIVDSAPSNATEWNEGFEFKCGQSAEISKADREKYFVDLSELKHLVESLEIVNRACGAERVIQLHERYKNNPVAHKYWLGVRVDRMAQAVADYESIYGGGDA
ncbi:hypothetical protein R4553_08395 [Acinetobacter baumannii]|nr:hypothetical protein [Acinetobacter baumannii]HCW3748781.1 hypothetical protein [Acinetobacter baumannii]